MEAAPNPPHGQSHLLRLTFATMPTNISAVPGVEVLDYHCDAVTIERAPVPSLGVSQTTFAEHMLIWEWDETSGWNTPQIRPYGPLPIMPGASVLQYATGCFEGIKIYRGHDDKLRVFRLQLNCERMLKSSRRVGLPEFEPERLKIVLEQFGAFIARTLLPRGQTGQTLYLRPTHIGTTPALGVQKPRQSLLYVVSTLLPGFSISGNGMRLVTSPADTIRAWPKGFGNAKLGGNYGPTLPAHTAAIAGGFDQVLWLFGDEGFVTEAGASNFFVVWKTSAGDIDLVTASLDDGLILEGVTRRSVLDAVRANQNIPSAWKHRGQSLPPLNISERNFSINEIKKAAGEGRLIEAFAAGTAVSWRDFSGGVLYVHGMLMKLLQYFISPAETIRHGGEDIHIPVPSTESASYALLIKEWLSDVVFGVKDAFGWTEEIAQRTDSE